jgi:hypothetical protein
VVGPALRVHEVLEVEALRCEQPVHGAHGLRDAASTGG